MKTVRNTTHRPLAVPLPGGKKLHLGPGKVGQIAAPAAEHPPLAKMVEDGELELVDTGGQRSVTAPGGTQVHAETGGHHPAHRSGHRGDR